MKIFSKIMQMKLKRAKRVLFIVLILVLIGMFFWLGIKKSGLKERLFHNQETFQIKRIAHGGGGINGDSYTNSIEALDYNIKNNFIYFEIDFSFTKDGKLACTHGWDFSNYFDHNLEEVPTLEEFESLVKNNSKYHNCTIYSLAEWMDRNPSAIIITDVKGDNKKALKIISETINNFEKRVVPQMFNPKEYQAIKEMGYENIIWTLYQYGGSDEKVLKWAGELDDLVAVTMPIKRAKTNLPQRLKEIDIPTYTHTVNSEEERLLLKNEYGVEEIYTDFLKPVE